MKVINDLYDYGLKIVQDSSYFKFSLDSILLAEFVRIHSKDQTIVDFCTGNGAVLLILSTLYKQKLIGIEVQEEIAHLAQESIQINHLEDQIKIYQGNVLESDQWFAPSSVDVIICNPPYFKVNEQSFINECPKKAIARHEIIGDIGSIIQMASKLLRTHGSFYLVHRVERLQEIFSFLKQNNLSVKELQFIYSNNFKDAIMVLFRTTKKGKVGLKVLPPKCIDHVKSFQGFFKEGLYEADCRNRKSDKRV